MRVGDIGRILELLIVDEYGAPEDISAGTLYIHVLNPVTKVTVIFNAVNGPVNNSVRYVTVSSADLPNDGTWKMQARIQLPGGADFKTEPVEFYVGANL